MSHRLEELTVEVPAMSSHVEALSGAAAHLQDCNAILRELLHAARLYRAGSGGGGAAVGGDGTAPHVKPSQQQQGQEQQQAVMALSRPFLARLVAARDTAGPAALAALDWGPSQLAGVGSGSGNSGALVAGGGGGGSGWAGCQPAITNQQVAMSVDGGTSTNSGGGGGCRQRAMNNATGGHGDPQGDPGCAKVNDPCAGGVNSRDQDTEGPLGVQVSGGGSGGGGRGGNVGAPCAATEEQQQQLLLLQTVRSGQDDAHSNAMQAQMSAQQVDVLVRGMSQAVVGAVQGAAPQQQQQQQQLAVASRVLSRASLDIGGLCTQATEPVDMGSLCVQPGEQQQQLVVPQNACGVGAGVNVVATAAAAIAIGAGAAASGSGGGGGGIAAAVQPASPDVCASYLTAATPPLPVAVAAAPQPSSHVAATAPASTAGAPNAMPPLLSVSAGGIGAPYRTTTTSAADKVGWLKAAAAAEAIARAVAASRGLSGSRGYPPGAGVTSQGPSSASAQRTDGAGPPSRAFGGLGSGGSDALLSSPGTSCSTGDDGDGGEACRDTAQGRDARRDVPTAPAVAAQPQRQQQRSFGHVATAQRQSSGEVRSGSETGGEGSGNVGGPSPPQQAAAHPQVSQQQRAAAAAAATTQPRSKPSAAAAAANNSPPATSLDMAAKWSSAAAAAVGVPVVAVSQEASGSAAARQQQPATDAARASIATGRSRFASAAGGGGGGGGGSTAHQEGNMGGDASPVLAMTSLSIQEQREQQQQQQQLEEEEEGQEAEGGHLQQGRGVMCAHGYVRHVRSGSCSSDARDAHHPQASQDQQ